MAAKRKSRPPRKQPVGRSKPQSTNGRPWWHVAVVVAGLVALALLLALIVFNRGGRDGGSVGLPHTSDYHSLLVSPTDSRRLTLGTHDGLYLSTDGGQHWRYEALSGNDAMNLARPTGDTIWLAGHEVFKKSVDGGASWRDVRSAGLPGLDIHGFAVDLHRPSTLYAAIAGEGLYRSRDGGRVFALVSRSVGAGVMALAVMPDGRILAGDMQRGLLESSDGQRWTQTLPARLMGLAISPSDPNRVLATGAGVALSTDGGRSWRSVLNLPEGAGPVAWSASDPKVAYAVGFDRVLYRSGDTGESWQPVGEGS